ncbi:MAG TPA: TIGR03936 family radical SAM-associated protein [Bacillota bacterium]|mgnify:FL=1|nr:TIGR03936 family radical SAM-associated protein [Bacillota bacterium]HPT35605.1 TIGR03936 family radical SAM-associated protein [Bacillota bacterium]
MRVRVKYTKGDKVRFLSHLDVTRNLRMALARAGWPVAMTGGYSPKMKVSFYAPLPVGTAGEEEYMDVVLDTKGIARLVRANAKCGSRKFRDIDILAQLTKAFSRVLPEGFSVKQVYLVDDGKQNFESQITGSLYRIEVEEVTTEDLSPAIEQFLTQEQVLYELERPKQTRTTDLRQFVESIEVVPGSSPATIFMKIRHDNGRTVRPQWVLESLSEFGLDIDTREVIVDRLKVYFD